MKLIIKKIYHTVLSDLGNPIVIKNLIQEHPGIIIPFIKSKNTMQYSSIVRWDLMADLGNSYATINGRQSAKEGMRFTRLHLPELINIYIEETVKNWWCDIREVQGFSASKSDLNQFDTMDEFALKNASTFIGAGTMDDLKSALNHPGIKVTNQKIKTDFFMKFLWSPRLYLMNTDGSHHFAAASYLAGQLSQSVPIYAELKVRHINPVSIRKLCERFEIYMLSNEPKNINAFFDAMDHFKASFYWMNMPSQYKEGKMILLPRNDDKSMQVSKLLTAANAFDVGNYLTTIALKQVPLHDKRF